MEDVIYKDRTDVKWKNTIAIIWEGTQRLRLMGDTLGGDCNRMTGGENN